VPVSIADLPFLAGLWQDAIVMRWLGGVPSDQQVESALAHDLSHWAEHGFGRWVLRADDVEVGQVKLAHWQGPNGDDEVEIGYAMLPAAWGLGFATEATRGALALAAERRLAESIVAFALVGNERSFRVIDRLGFHYEVEFQVAAGTSRLYRRSLGGPD
jgi:[ribosomal protein S5]-alanine N-acetyltransferase